MTPDPSGAARAPQSLLDEVKVAVARLTEAREASNRLLPMSPWDDIDRVRDEYFEAKRTLETLAPEWLGALVQAVEDQQRELSAARNPCAKIFDHKWLDPSCVEEGCQSLYLKHLREEVAKATAILDNAGAKYGDGSLALFERVTDLAATLNAERTKALAAEREVAQFRADGQRLRDALDTIYKIAAGGDVRRTAFEALHPDEAPPSDAL